MPCADMEASGPTHKTSQFSSEENHSHDKQTDLCSPFCACNCCGVQVLSYHHNVVFEFPVRFFSISLAVPNYKSVFASNFYGSIWQPPQIV
ncbi:hypothetical protein J2W48_004567 [Flavobacterium piscis]|uniref:Uncharacterized protein n=2 Tax=Flavobacterium piscis TaxID=1114874 RepID=A0ABU1YEE1_9FLAO|nr:hypothetical protein [Flavobacterium piscis]